MPIKPCSRSFGWLGMKEWKRQRKRLSWFYMDNYEDPFLHSYATKGKLTVTVPISQLAIPQLEVIVWGFDSSAHFLGLKFECSAGQGYQGTGDAQCLGSRHFSLRQQCKAQMLGGKTNPRALSSMLCRVFLEVRLGTTQP